MRPRPLILVTGSSGLIGSRVLEDLARDHHVVGFDVAEPEQLPPGASFISCDLTSDDSVRRALQTLAEDHGRHIASVIHLAAYYDFAGEPSELYEQLTVEGTRRLLTGLQRFRVEQFLFSSTILVMREAEAGETITEGSPLQAEWDYPRSKIAAERVIATERGPIPAVILRLAGIYDEQGHSPPITQQISRIYERELESHLFPGNQDHGQPFVHLDDAVAAVRHSVERRHSLAPWEVFLIAEDELLPYGELQDRIGELIHGEDDWTTLRIPAPVAKAGAWAKDTLTDEDPFIKPWMVDLADTHMPVSNARARHKLGWVPEHKLSETLPEIIENLRADPEDFYEENSLAS